MPGRARPLLHRLCLACVLAANAGAALALSRHSAGPFVDAKWLAIGLGCAALLVLYSWGWTKERRSAAPGELLAGLFVLALGIGVSGIAAKDRAATLPFLPPALAPLLWAAMILTTRWYRRDLAFLQAGLTALAVLLALIGLGQYYAPAATGRITGWVLSPAKGRAAIVSTIGNPEYLAGFLAPAAVLALAGVARATKASFALWAGWCPALLCLLWALALTEARGAWLGFAVGALVLFLCLQRAEAAARLESPCAHPGDPAAKTDHADDRTRPGEISSAERGNRSSPGGWALWVTLGASAVLLILVALPTPLNPYRTSLVGRVAQTTDIHSSSLQQRLLLYTVAAGMIRTHPWAGTGPNAFSRRFAEALTSMRTPETEGSINRIAYRLGGLSPGFVHCDWLQFWVENGVLGAAGFLWLIAASVVLGWKATRSVRGGSSQIFLLSAYAGAWFCGAFYSLFAFPFHSPDRVLFYWTIFGLMGASLREALAGGGAATFR